MIGALLRHGVAALGLVLSAWWCGTPPISRARLTITKPGLGAPSR